MYRRAPELIAPFMSPISDKVELTWMFEKDGQENYFTVRVEADGTLVTGRPPVVISSRQVAEDLLSMRLVPFGLRNADGKLLQECD